MHQSGGAAKMQFRRTDGPSANIAGLPHIRVTRLSHSAANCYAPDPPNESGIIGRGKSDPSNQSGIGRQGQVDGHLGVKCRREMGLGLTLEFSRHIQ